MSRRIISLVLSFGLLFQQISFAQVAAELNLANYLSKIGGNIIQDKFRPLHLRYFSYDGLNDNFKVVLDKGDLKNLKNPELENSTKTLLSYFLVGVALPDSMFWVNLRPDSEDQIIDQYLGKTDVGKIMLEADLQLKKDTAQMTSPATPEGKKYWDKLYKKAAELYGYDNVTIPTLTRPWIVPGEIIVRESQDSAYIYKATLKVMLEQDYLKDSATYNFKDERSKALNEYSSQLIRELIIPKLIKEVNSSKRYAALRQVYYSLILSRWFKLRFTGKTGTYASLINSQNLTNLISQEAWSKTNYFKQYQKSFADGEYNIKEPVYTPTGQVIRSYFSGGINVAAGTINTQNGIVLAKDNASKLGDVIGGKAVIDPRNVNLQSAVVSSPVKTSSIGSAADTSVRVSEKLKEIGKNSGLPISTILPVVPTGVSDNDLWSETLHKLNFESPVYRRVETVDTADKKGERTTGVVGAVNVFSDSQIAELPDYEVSSGPFKSIRYGSDLKPKTTAKGETKGYLMDKDSAVTRDAYFMHRGVYASREDIQKAFYGANKLRFDITVIPPALWGEEYAKTIGHYHFPVEYPEIYQVVSGEALWILQKCKIDKDAVRDETAKGIENGKTPKKAKEDAIKKELDKGEIEDFIVVRAKAGDIVIMLPGYGHVSINISETEPLVMADWLTWHQDSYYGSFNENRGAAFYAIRNDKGEIELVHNTEYKNPPEKIRQMAAKDTITEFGLKRGEPIYNLVKLNDKDFLEKTRFLYHPTDPQYKDLMTPEATLDEVKQEERIEIFLTSLAQFEAASLPVTIEEDIQYVAAEMIPHHSSESSRADLVFSRAKLKNIATILEQYSTRTVTLIDITREKLMDYDGPNYEIEEIILKFNSGNQIMAIDISDLPGTNGEDLGSLFNKLLNPDSNVRALAKDVASKLSLEPLRQLMQLLQDKYNATRDKSPSEENQDYYGLGLEDPIVAATAKETLEYLEGLEHNLEDKGSSSPLKLVPEKTGGIDFRALPMIIQPMGSFAGLNFKLPQLSQAELRQINVDSEIQQIKNMVQSGIIPSGQRIKELVAACIQKKEMNSQVDGLLLCIADIFKLEEENANESSPELREALVIVDSRS